MLLASPYFLLPSQSLLPSFLSSLPSQQLFSHTPFLLLHYSHILTLSSSTKTVPGWTFSIISKPTLATLSSRGYTYLATLDLLQPTAQHTIPWRPGSEPGYISTQVSSHPSHVKQPSRIAPLRLYYISGLLRSRLFNILLSPTQPNQSFPLFTGVLVAAAQLCNSRPNTLALRSSSLGIVSASTLTKPDGSSSHSY